MKTTASTSVMNEGLHPGRILWYWQDINSSEVGMAGHPFAAIVTRVHPADENMPGTTLVDLAVFSHGSGRSDARLSVPLYMPDADDEHGSGSQYATWMPYQVNALEPAPAQAA
jgi:hypothetical protein